MSFSRNISLGSLSEPDEIVELSILYDFYGALLKEKHREIFEDYIWNNLSLGEIAKDRQITRQGVYDIVRRCRIRLLEYEESLRLVYKFEQTKQRLKKIQETVKKAGVPKLSEEIAKLAEEIYDLI